MFPYVSIAFKLRLLQQRLNPHWGVASFIVRSLCTRSQCSGQVCCLYLSSNLIRKSYNIVCYAAEDVSKPFLFGQLPAYCRPGFGIQHHKRHRIHLRVGIFLTSERSKQ